MTFNTQAKAGATPFQDLDAVSAIRDLSDEQVESISGGGASNRAKITSIHSNKSGADDDKEDDLVLAGGELGWNGKMRTNDTKFIGKYAYGGVTLGLLEVDFPGKSEVIGRDTLPVSGTAGTQGKPLRFVGNGSDYTVSYEWH